MPATLEPLVDHSIMLVEVQEPFRLQDLVELGDSTLFDSLTFEQLSWTKVFDFRKAPAFAATESEIRKALRSYKLMPHYMPDIPAAFVASDPWAFGALRMFTTYAVIEGVRTDSRTLVTTSFDEAMSWARAQGNGADAMPP